MVLNREFSLSDQVTAVFPKLRVGSCVIAKSHEAEPATSEAWWRQSADTCLAEFAHLATFRAASHQSAATLPVAAGCVGALV